MNINKHESLSIAIIYERNHSKKSPFEVSNQEVDDKFSHIAIKQEAKNIVI